MSKHISPADRHPVAGQSVTLESTRVIVEPVTNNPAGTSAKHPGKVNYLGKTKPVKAKSVTVTPVRRVEHTVLMTGRYFGSSEQVRAFVMLDEDSAPKGDAANDPKIR